MITILNTGVANISSVLYALERIGFAATVTDQPDLISKSSHVILPGVGTASALIANLKSRKLESCLKNLKQPVLGICLGMQVMYEHSEEGNADCLGIFKGSVQRLHPTGHLPVPHMGWNQVKIERPSQLFNGIPDKSHFYYVHSYRAPVQSEVSATSDYGEIIPAAVEHSNWFGTQFHPERSGEVGEKLLRNFLAL